MDVFNHSLSRFVDHVIGSWHGFVTEAPRNVRRILSAIQNNKLIVSHEAVALYSTESIHPDVYRVFIKISSERQRYHDDVIKWKNFPRCYPFVRGIHRSPVNSPHKGQWRGGLMFSLICTRINGWVSNREAGDLRRHRAYYDVIVMKYGNASLSAQKFDDWIHYVGHYRHWRYI